MVSTGQPNVEGSCFQMSRETSSNRILEVPMEVRPKFFQFQPPLKGLEELRAGKVEQQEERARVCSGQPDRLRHARFVRARVSPPRRAVCC